MFLCHVKVSDVSALKSLESNLNFFFVVLVRSDGALWLDCVDLICVDDWILVEDWESFDLLVSRQMVNFCL